MSRIEMWNVTKKFGAKEVLGGISFQIEEGEIFGLLGPSGAGKTTIIKILTGQIHSFSGKAAIFEKDVLNIGSEEYAKMGMVLDNSGLYERLSCYDNLAVFAEVQGISKKEIKPVLEKAGLKGSEKTSAGKLSKGMKQRLILARTIMKKPKLLFLDEPTSGLDPATMKEIHKLILELKEQGTTIFLTTHNMTEATYLCNRISLLYQGKLVETGVPEEICRKHNTRQEIKILLKDGREVVYLSGKQDAEAIADCFREDMVESVHSTEPDLETVFMELTGAQLLQ